MAERLKIDPSRLSTSEDLPRDGNQPAKAIKAKGQHSSRIHKPRGLIKLNKGKLAGLQAERTIWLILDGES